MRDYEYINENGKYIDYWTLVEDNKQLWEENEKQKEINKKAIEYIKEIDFNYLEETCQNSTKEYLERILQILEDKEV